MDIFIPVEKESRESRGFTFVCFNTEREAAKAVELIDGRSWNGRKLQANVAR